MDINFPLVLVILTLVSGLMWLLDKLLLRRLRGEAPAPFYVEYTAPFFPVLFVVLVLRSFIVEPFQIPSASMVPTLQVGDFILVNKFAYGLRMPVTQAKIVDIGEPERGDVMVFFPPDDPRYFIKRVIGLPGDHVQLFDNQLFVNGEKIQQKRLSGPSLAGYGYDIVEESIEGESHLIRKHRVPGRLGRRVSVVVPAGHYFMMGDNRDNSSDSRVWGSVPEENIVGKAFAIWMHWDDLFSLPGFDRAGKIQ
ncbi:MAG: signal peptidase [Gammaproteobacteria bacterium BRH_c0]|nr:MAG: signal peptidase [Gammaproteobacteria bacterium BRH_c0]